MSLRHNIYRQIDYGTTCLAELEHDTYNLHNNSMK